MASLNINGHVPYDMHPAMDAVKRETYSGTIAPAVFADFDMGDARVVPVKGTVLFNRIPASTRRMGRGYHGSMKVAPVAKASAAAPVRTPSVRRSPTMELGM